MMRENDNGEQSLKVGLVSMPWIDPGFPSVQLATVGASLKDEGIESDVFELYLDYGKMIGLGLYGVLANYLGFTSEWIFAKHYFGPETGDDLDSYREIRPRIGLESFELEDQVLDVITPVTEHFLETSAEEIRWSDYNVIGFSLTISQVASSMALARRIKKKHPQVHIVFGGAECAGTMGRAILEICPYVDAVVHVEGEQVFAELVRRLSRGDALQGLEGVSWRGTDGEFQGSTTGPLYTTNRRRAFLNYDAYFEKIERLGLKDRVMAWLPFESSRGCWYGEKMQCTFCGLHEIMKFRSWEGEAVLAEMEHLHERYGVDKFFAVDLILPRSFFDTMLPEIDRRGHRWTIFYEVKANMKRSEVALLSRAGVRFIQPGIESLDQDILRLMKKGVSPIQNIQLLKWSREMGVYAYWNLITGLPGEQQEHYTRMVTDLPSLYHLTPPTGVGPLQMHRFSPYFEQPAAYGIRLRGAHPLYEHIFPVGKELRDDLVYLWDFEFVDLEATPIVDLDPLRATTDAWRKAFYDNKADLRFRWLDGGAAEIRDTRHGPEKVFELEPHEAELYVRLDAATTERSVWSRFEKAKPEAAAAFSSEQEAKALLDRWHEDALIFRSLGKVMGLAIDAVVPEEKFELTVPPESSIPLENLDFEKIPEVEPIPAAS